MQNITKTFFELVQINSPSGQEGKMVKYITKWLEKIGLKYTVDKLGNIYATNQVEGEPVLLCAHMDTVEPAKNIKPTIKNGIIKSSGNTILGADNKATVAGIIHTIEQLQDEKLLNKIPLEILFTVKEETGGGVEHFDFTKIMAKKCVIFDAAYPPGGIILASPFIENFHIEIKGKASHASKPQNGINAFTPTIESLSQIPTGQVDNDTTINIGKIHGGSGINTIPDSIKISGEVRSYEKKLFANWMQFIKGQFEASAKKYDCKIKFKKDGFCPGYKHHKNQKFIKEIENIFKTSDLKVKYYDKSGVSDANILNAQGIETINLTDGAQYVHTTKEQISIANLEKLSELMIKIVKQKNPLKV